MFSIHRILILIFIIRLLKVKDYFALLLATIPTLLIFFHLLGISEEMSKIEFYLLILHNILISILAGIALCNFIMQTNYNTSWLLICVLFFVMLQFIVFIEKFYLNLMIFRPIAMILNVLAFYSFYKFVIITEKSNNDWLSFWCFFLIFFKIKIYSAKIQSVATHLVYKNVLVVNIFY